MVSMWEWPSLSTSVGIIGLRQSWAMTRLIYARACENSRCFLAESAKRREHPSWSERYFTTAGVPMLCRQPPPHGRLAAYIPQTRPASFFEPSSVERVVRLPMAIRGLIMAAAVSPEPRASGRPPGLPAVASVFRSEGTPHSPVASLHTPTLVAWAPTPVHLA